MKTEKNEPERTHPVRIWTENPRRSARSTWVERALLRTLIRPGQAQPQFSLQGTAPKAPRGCLGNGEASAAILR